MGAQKERIRPKEMTRCVFVSDIHGNIEHYEKLLRLIEEEAPEAVFLGGDLFPSILASADGRRCSHGDFIRDFLVRRFLLLREQMKQAYPVVFVIMGNDDGRFSESFVLEGEAAKAWSYVHNKKVSFSSFQVFGYSYIPPTPFLLKDWERYDVSRYIDPGCVSPEEGLCSIQIPQDERKNATIKQDLDRLVEGEDLARAIFLFHAPPYESNLDRAALDGKTVSHVPLDRHVGSIAIRRFIEAHEPLLTLHGHVHESARLTGFWRDRIGRTHTFSAAYDGPELAVIRFALEDLDSATRELI